MINFSQAFVVYHGCGNGYLHGTRKILSKNRNCLRPPHYSFWKKPVDVRNRVETRAQLKLKLLEKTSSLMKTLIIQKLIRYLTHKIQTMKMKQIMKLYLVPCDYRT